MKKIEAIIRPEKLPVVKAALEQLGYPGMTITEVKGHGTQKGIVQEEEGRRVRVEFLPKVRIDIVVPDTAVEYVVELIAANARTGDIGDGKIFVVPVEEVMRVRTGQRGEVAV